MSKATLIINNFDHVLTIEPRDMSNMIDHVPAMVYKALIKDKIILIKDRPTFTLPKKRYGKHNRYFQQISSAYDKSGPAVGVLLRGEKGSGKSLLAEEIGNWAIKQDVPVVMVSTPMSAEALGLVIKAIGPCVVYFDEFGKVYGDAEDRNQLLPLFSDTSLVGVLFIVTGNDADEFSDYMYLRPQRFRYQIFFPGRIDEEAVRDVIDDYGVAEQFHEILHAYGRSGDINFDSMLCVVREAAQAEDLNDLYTRVEVLNVPELPVAKWTIDEVDTVDKLPSDVAFRADIRNGDRLQLVEHQGADPSSTPPKTTSVTLKKEQLVDGRIDLMINGHYRYRAVVSFGFEGHSTSLCGGNVHALPSRIGRPSYRGQDVDGDTAAGFLSTWAGSTAAMSNYGSGRM